MAPEILVIAEHNGSELDPITLDLISWGSQIAHDKNWRVGVLAVGYELAPILEGLRGTAVDVIFTLDDAAFKDYNSCVYVAAIAAALKPALPRLIVLGHSYLGIEISGGLAAAVDATLWNNCRTVKATAHGYLVTRPMSGGAYVSTLEIDSGTCNLISMQRGSSPATRLTAQSPTPPKTPEVVRWPLPAQPGAINIKVTGETKATFTEDITKADLLVAVGRGIGEQSRLPAFRDLAQALGGVIAASRPIVDSGWLPVDYQVGLSGRTVQPKVYLACGISGSAQHMAGMRNSRLIIAINQDENAPIFQIAHYGIVGDIFQIVPAMMDAVKSSA